MLMIDAHLHVEKLSIPFSANCIYYLNAVDETNWPVVMAYASSNTYIKPFIGSHPWYLHKLNPGWDKRMENELTRHPQLGVGEIGLDKIRKEISLELQIEVFTRQLELALKYRRPVTIHCVRAWDELFNTLDRLKIKKINSILHRFEASKEILAKLLEYGFYISFFSTLQKREKIKKAFESCDINAIFLETDAGNGPDPAALSLNYEEAAQIKKMPVEELIKVIWHNGQVFTNQAFNRK